MMLALVLKQKKRKIDDDGESGLDGISKEQRIATRCKFKKRKVKLKVFRIVLLVLYKFITKLYTCLYILYLCAS